MAVATGNWGCGAFGGDPHLKALIQLMAASANERDLAFLTVRNTQLARDVHLLYQSARECGMSVAQLYDSIVGYGKTIPPPGFKFASYCSRRFDKFRLMRSPSRSRSRSRSRSPGGSALTRKRSLPASNDSRQVKDLITQFDTTGASPPPQTPTRASFASSGTVYDAKKYQSHTVASTQQAPVL